jgi:hypothetical protein
MELSLPLIVILQCKLQLGILQADHISHANETNYLSSNFFWRRFLFNTKSYSWTTNFEKNSQFGNVKIWTCPNYEFCPNWATLTLDTMLSEFPKSKQCSFQIVGFHCNEIFFGSNHLKQHRISRNNWKNMSYKLLVFQ